MQQDEAPTSQICGVCKEELAPVATLTVVDGVAHLLPKDPVVIQHLKAPYPMHKCCAMNWFKKEDLEQAQVTIPLAPNSIGHGGISTYFPPDTIVTPIADKDGDSFKFALRNESERGCVLAAAAFLDSVLAEMLIVRFTNGRVGEKLVRGFNSPLGTFSSRITAAFALGLLAESEHKQLDRIRRIRNDFAHTFANVRFVDPGVKSRVEILPAHPVAMSSAEEPTRRRFESAIEVLLSNLRYRLDNWRDEEAASVTLSWCFPCNDSGAMKISEVIELGVELRDPWLESLRGQPSAG